MSIDNQIALDPHNPQRGRVFFHGQTAHEAGENRHAQIVMRELAGTCGFTILDAVPQTMHDGWDFWIEWQGEKPPELPPYFYDDLPWKPVGEA